VTSRGRLAPLLLGAGLLSAEAALATTGFLFAYALILDCGSLSRRLARLLPYLLIVVAWKAVYFAGGYGVKAPGFHYVHPLREPLAYAVQLIEGAPLLILGQLTPLAADFGGLYPPVVKVAVLLLAIALPVLVARIAWRRLAAEPQARFWLIGAGLSLLPACASGPTDSNLVFVGLGAAPALAILLASFVDQPPAARWPRLLVATLAVFNLALAPLMLPAKCLTTLGIESSGAQTDESIPHDAGIAQKTLVVVSVASDGHLGYVRTRRDVAGIPFPSKARILVASFGDVSVTRLDDVTLRLRPADGFFANPMHRLYNDPARPLREGDVVELSDMTATVTEVAADGRPLTVEFRFAAPLESPEWLWMRGAGMRLVGWTPPKVGETVVVQGSS
jgi:hypothetical protein